MKTKQRLSIVIACFLIGITAITHADTIVRVFDQNIQAHILCSNPNLENQLETYIKNNNFDFILTQEYEGYCSGLFNDIQTMGYSITMGPGDSTLFYKSSVWIPQSESRVNTTPNTPDGWGHDGTRQAVFGVYKYFNQNLSLNIGTAHLCVTYPGASGYSTCVIDQPQAHLDDFNTLENVVNSSANWLIAGDMNAAGDEKEQRINQIKADNAIDISGLDSQAFDMAFYKGNNIKDMQESPADLHGISDHAGFVLMFTLTE